MPKVMSVEDNQWRAREDAAHLIAANEIKNDAIRFRTALAITKELAAEAEEKAKAALSVSQTDNAQAKKKYKEGFFQN